LWWRLEEHPLAWQHDVGIATRAVAVSPVDELLAAGCDDGTVQLVSLDSRSARTIRAHHDVVQAVAFSGDGRWLASGGLDGRVLLYDPETKELSKELVSGGSGVLALSFLPGAKQLAAAQRDGKVRILSLSGAPQRVLEVGSLAVRSLDVSRDGRHLAAGSDDGKVSLFEPAVGQSSRRVLDANHIATDALAFSDDGKLLVSGGRDDVIRVWNSDDGRLVRSLRGHTNDVMSLDVNGAGTIIASASFDRSVRLWDVASGQPLATLDGHDSGVYGVSFSGDDRSIASSAYDRNVRLWRIDRALARSEQHGHGDRVTGVSIHPNGRTLATSGTDGTVRVWSRATGEQVAVLRGHSEEVWSVAHSPDGKQLASASSDDSVRVYNSESGATERVLSRHDEDVNDVAFAPDGARIASAGLGRKAYVWRVEDGEQLALMHTGGTIFRLGFDPSGTRLVTAGSDFVVTIWDLAGHGGPRKLDSHTDRVRAAMFADADHVVSASDDKRVNITSLDDGSVTHLQHEVRVSSVDAHGVNRIASGAADGVVRLWDDQKGPPRALFGHRGIVYTTRFSHDGEVVASASADGTVRLWEHGAGRPAWRAPWLLDDDLLTHAGWRALDGGTPRHHDIPAALLDELRDHVEYAEADDEVLCMLTHEGELQVWDRPTGRRQASFIAAPLAEIRAFHGGCVVSSRGRVSHLGRDGVRSELPIDAPATAIAVGAAGELLAANHHELVVFDASRHVTSRRPIERDASALAHVEAERFVVGYRDGHVELRAADGEPVVFDQTPSSAPLRIVASPHDTVTVGFENGLVGVWDAHDGVRLVERRLHGPVVHLRLTRGSLLTATDVGDHLRWELSWLLRDHCDLLRQVWHDTPVVWQEGRIAHAAPPAGHPCIGK
jgi:WD40 repeat protein